jgi:hypothetical protein
MAQFELPSFDGPAHQLTFYSYHKAMDQAMYRRDKAPIRKGKGPARRLLKARILLKTDVPGAGAGWSVRRQRTLRQEAA